MPGFSELFCIADGRSVRSGVEGGKVQRGKKFREREKITRRAGQNLHFQGLSGGTQFAIPPDAWPA